MNGGVAPRLGSQSGWGLLPLAEDLPVQPRPASVSNSESKFSPSAWAERGFRSLQQGEVQRKPGPVRSFLEPCFLFLPPKKGWEVLLFQVGRKRGQSWSSWRWRWGAHPVPVPVWVRAPGPNLREWAARISTISNTHPTTRQLLVLPLPGGTVLGEQGRDSWNHYRLFWKAVLGMRGLDRTHTTELLSGCPAASLEAWSRLVVVPHCAFPSLAH